MYVIWERKQTFSFFCCIYFLVVFIIVAKILVVAIQEVWKQTNKQWINEHTEKTKDIQKHLCINAIDLYLSVSTCACALHFIGVSIYIRKRKHNWYLNQFVHCARARSFAYDLSLFSPLFTGGYITLQMSNNWTKIYQHAKHKNEAQTRHIWQFNYLTYGLWCHLSFIQLSSTFYCRCFSMIFMRAITIFIMNNEFRSFFFNVVDKSFK